MCGRYAQYRIPWEYLKPIGLDVPLVGGMDPEPINRYNVAPRSKVRILHQEPGGLRWDLVSWGWEPFWAKVKRPPAINARVETAATSKFFSAIWKSGRCVIPADGWYEWVKGSTNAERKQPYYIYRRDSRPMYFAGIGQFRRDGGGSKEGDGFVIITANSDSGMVDIHDRKPIVLSPETARRWLDPQLTAAEAELAISEIGEPVAVFKWHPVKRDVGNVRNEGPDLIEATTGASG